MLLIEHGCQHGDDHSIVLMTMTFDVYDDTDDTDHDDDGHDDLGQWTCWSGHDDDDGHVRPNLIMCRRCWITLRAHTPAGSNIPKIHQRRIKILSQHIKIYMKSDDYKLQNIISHKFSEDV